MPRTSTSATLSSVVGATMRRRRLELNLTQAAVATRLDVSSAYVQAVEAGRGNLTLAQAARFAQALESTLALSLNPRSHEDAALARLKADVVTDT